MLTGDPFKRSYEDSLTSEAIGWNWYAPGDVLLVVLGTLISLCSVQPGRRRRRDAPAVLAAVQLPERPARRDSLPGGSACSRTLEIAADLDVSLRQSCWDGVNLDSSDHFSHMAYPLVNEDGRES